MNNRKQAVDPWTIIKAVQTTIIKYDWSSCGIDTGHVFENWRKYYGYARNQQLKREGIQSMAYLDDESPSDYQTAMMQRLFLTVEMFLSYLENHLPYQAYAHFSAQLGAYLSRWRGKVELSLNG